MPTYKWDNPGDWLLYHITQRADLRSLALRLATLLDSDEIQDEFQDEMDEDGYFQPID